MICAVKLVHLLSAFHVREGRATAQQEVGANTNEIPEFGPRRANGAYHTGVDPNIMLIQLNQGNG
jgi:hypothetical protein